MKCIKNNLIDDQIRNMFKRQDPDNWKNNVTIKSQLLLYLKHISATFSQRVDIQSKVNQWSE